MTGGVPGKGGVNHEIVIEVGQGGVAIASSGETIKGIRGEFIMQLPYHGEKVLDKMQNLYIMIDEQVFS